MSVQQTVGNDSGYDFRLREESRRPDSRPEGNEGNGEHLMAIDISQPAEECDKRHVQWLYFGYLAAIKTQNGAAMSVGRISTFLDIYIERDLKTGILTEAAGAGAD